MQLGQRLDRRLARMFVLATTTGSPLLLRDRHRRDLARRSSRAPAPRARCCERSAKASWSARAMPKSAATFSAGLRHRVDAVLLLHQRVDEAPADRRVVDLGVAREKALSAFGITNGARVMLSTPPAIISSASPAAMARAQMATASMPDPHSRLTVAAGHVGRQPGQQHRHARDVAVVLARLVGAAEDDVVDRSPVDAGIALHQRLQRNRGEVVGAHGRQRAAVATDRRADAVTEEDVVHAIAFNEWGPATRFRREGDADARSARTRPMPPRKRSATIGAMSA